MLVLSFDYPPCIPFTLSPCPDTLGDYFGLSRARWLCARTVCSETEKKDALFIPAQPSRAAITRWSHPLAFKC